MDPRLLTYYNQELQFVRESGAEFAEEYPKIASRLGIDVFECADPYVERLFEGFALLAARIQLKLDAEFPRFTQHLLEMVCPHYLAPMPSMAIVELNPDLTEGALAEGFQIPRGTVLQSLLGKGEQTRCTFRTAHPVTLWPLQLTEANYYSRDVAALSLPDDPTVKAALVIRLDSTAGLKINQLSLETLPLFVRGASDVPMRLYEQLMSNAVGIAVRPANGTSAWTVYRGKDKVTGLGFEDENSLLPYGPRSFKGYRLLQEYFSFPHRYMFANLRDLGESFRSCDDNAIEIAILLNRRDSRLSNRVDETHFALYCTPAINLFEKRADRIHLSERFSQYQVMPDRTRPVDFEVYSVTDVRGYGNSNDREQEFRPFYQINDSDAEQNKRAYYTLHRRPRVLSAKHRQYGPRSSYVGSETFLSLVDANEAPFSHELKQLGIDTLCTNRDLPLQMPVGVGETDFTLEISAPVKAVRCLVGPTKPEPSRSYENGQTTWRLISHLSLNYLSLIDEDGSANALRELLSLYSDINNVLVSKQIDAVRSVRSAPVTRPIASDGPLCFARGMEVTVTLDETGFEGTGAFLLAAVLNEFFAKYVSINSFTETVFRTTDRGEVMRWPARIGRRHTL
ncbi:type VI secretion system baseplate subunit TssF [Rhodopirellula sp. MGV]|uniref:type VI secretion system baseplate subunit TssF n=1 Tax=Rhodopirellula sp. MGV TaxID=2023130 RepID=UPI000B9633D4|nr:type VI secretion system baseplate subunit TssF [Rhodopirellula sp. MGV]OYP35791.1 type VI secretion system ImpG/VasA family protein [Rhodopirellula sp. MGV]PNY36396.1 type VI secretion system baseplate subunit TssF [Rhodopirellula baltica]